MRGHHPVAARSLPYLFWKISCKCVRLTFSEASVMRHPASCGRRGREPSFLVLLLWLGACEGRLTSRQDDVVEIDACRAGDVDLVDQLESEDAKRRPREIRIVAQG